MIRLGSLAGYPFEGPRLLAGWTAPAAAAVYAIAYKPDPDANPDKYAIIYVGHSDDLTRRAVPVPAPARALLDQAVPAPGGRSTSAPSRCPAEAGRTGSRSPGS